MKGRMRPYLPELTIRDYNTYMRYLRGVRRQMYKSYGFYACHLLRTNGVLFAILSDSLAGRMPTCKRQRVPGTPFRRSMMCQTLGIRQAAQTEILMGWHNLQDRKYSELRPAKRVRRAADKLLLRRAYKRAVEENPALERLFVQEREQAVAQMNLSAKNYALAAEPMSNVYGALYSTLATDDPNQRKSMRYIGSCIGRIFYLLDKAERFETDRCNGQYNVFVVNELNGQAAAMENARRQALAAVNDLMRAYKMLDLICVYPVEDETKFTDHFERVLPDAFLVPRGSTARDLAYRVHSDLGDKFIRAVNAKTKRTVGADYELQDGDVIRIVANK